MQFRTRDDYQSALRKLIKPLKPYYSKGGALLHIGEMRAWHSERTAELEAFARILWGLVPFWKGGGETDLEEIYLNGIKNGTDPKSEEYWGSCTDFDQSFVEMAAIALGLILIPQKLWDPLDEVEKDNLCQWLLQINEYDMPANNWRLFRVLVNIALKQVGSKYSQKSIEASLALIETHYLGDGWYVDATQQKDYYVAFAIHYYLLLYAKIMKEEDPERSQNYIDRAKIFAHDFIYWFSETGESIPFGRSLIYRFAQCAFWSALAFADTEVFSWGVMKGIINRHMRYWFDKPILDYEGKLTIGYTYPNTHITENYNAPGSPYWSMKSFLILALDEQHPFWKAEEEALPPLDSVKTLQHAGMVICRPHTGHVFALTSGQYAGFEPTHVAEKYAKFAYSTRFGFSMPRSYNRLEYCVPDNMLSFYKDGLYHVRRTCMEWEAKNNAVYSVWSPMEGVLVETVLTPHQEGYICKNRITAQFECECVYCGFALPETNDDDISVNTNDRQIKITNANGMSALELLRDYMSDSNSNSKLASKSDSNLNSKSDSNSNSELVSKLDSNSDSNLDSKSNSKSDSKPDSNSDSMSDRMIRNGRFTEIYASPNTNLLYPRTVVPCFRFHMSKGVTEVELYVWGV